MEDLTQAKPASATISVNVIVSQLRKVIRLDRWVSTSMEIKCFHPVAASTVPHHLPRRPLLQVGLSALHRHVRQETPRAAAAAAAAPPS